MNEPIELSKADVGKLQDAWHYATLILDRSNSTFDGDREYPEGIRGQMKAYEQLLKKIDQMAGDNDTWQLVKAKWWTPADWFWVHRYTEEVMGAIKHAAKRFGVDLRTAQAPEAR